MPKWWVVMPGWWWSALGFVLGTGLGMPPSGHTLIPMMRFHANDRHRCQPAETFDRLRRFWYARQRVYELNIVDGGARFSRAGLLLGALDYFEAT
jgi:hypothetical protein